MKSREGSGATGSARLRFHPEITLGIPLPQAIAYIQAALLDPSTSRNAFARQLHTSHQTLMRWARNNCLEIPAKDNSPENSPTTRHPEAKLRRQLRRKRKELEQTSHETMSSHAMEQIEKAQREIDDELAALDDTGDAVPDAKIMYFRDLKQHPSFSNEDNAKIFQSFYRPNKRRLEAIKDLEASFETKSFTLPPEQQDAIRKKRRKLQDEIATLTIQLTPERHKIVMGNQRFVASLVRSILQGRTHLGTASEIQLIQAGNDGLDKAIDTFDPAKGFMFTTHAYFSIRQQIIREVNKSRYMGTMAHSTVPTYRRVQKMQELDPSLTDEAIAKEVHITTQRAHDLRAPVEIVSIDRPVYLEEDEVSFSEILGDDSRPNIERRQLVVMLLTKAMESLDDREKLIIHHHTVQGRALEEVGEEIFPLHNFAPVTRERIRQIRDTALEKIKKSPYGSALENILRED